MFVSEWLQERQKLDFLAHMAPTCPQLAPQDGPKLGQKSVQNRSKNGLGSEVGSGADLGPILSRFWDDLWSIFGLNLVAFLH